LTPGFHSKFRFPMKKKISSNCYICALDHCTFSAMIC
jgi:hypothetical protein